MELKEIQNKDTWENFFLDYKDKTFLQSWNWGEFWKGNGLPAGRQALPAGRQGNKIWRLGVFDEDKLIGLALVSKIKAKRGTFLLIQHGPSFAKASEGKATEFKVLLEELKRIGKEEKVDFIRMNPLLERTEENKKMLKDFGFRESPMHASAYESTWKLDITFSEEDLLREMRKTTRYLIRQTQKDEDIVIEKSEKLEDVDLYQKLNETVAKRHRFVSFSLESVRSEFKVFSKEKEAVLLFGKYKGEIAAVALLIFWSGVGFYHQAASDSKYAKLSIPYLLQWEAILEAKRRGCVVYDFWGYVDPKKEPKHPWAGPTLFKMGFGGKGYEYIKTQDYPLSKKYWLIYGFEKVRSIKRGL